MSISENEFKNLKIGDSIEIYIDKNDCWCEKENSLKTITATVISEFGKLKNPFIVNGILICFQKSLNGSFGVDFNAIESSYLQRYPAESIATIDFLTKELIEYKKDLLYFFYTSELFIDKINEKLVIASQKLPEPLQCCRCNDGNPWAESNLPNGKFMCFSCRDSNKWLYSMMLEVHA